MLCPKTAALISLVIVDVVRVQYPGNGIGDADITNTTGHGPTGFHTPTVADDVVVDQTDRGGISGIDVLETETAYVAIGVGKDIIIGYYKEVAYRRV